MSKKPHWWNQILVPRKRKQSWMQLITNGRLYENTDIANVHGQASIKNLIDTMRALAQDSQIQTALNYYATDATTANNAGDVIWASAVDDDHASTAELVNSLLKRWDVNSIARSHILELATIGNLYIPTTYMYRNAGEIIQRGVALDNNTIPDNQYDIIPRYKIPPENILHVWKQGKPIGYIYQPDDTSERILFPEHAIIHFNLGGLLGDYTFESTDPNTGDDVEYDIQFADPLLKNALQPTQTLSLLEDANVLASLSRTIKFINVRCGGDETEIRETLTEVKSMIEQQLSLNTSNGDIQNYINPQSTKNLIYVPYVDDQEAITITDLNMTDATDADNQTLDYYQNKKLSVLGIPKEYMNYSGAEGLGQSGTVLSQRSSIYANALQRLEIGYMTGWKHAINYYFAERNLSGYINQYELHMNPIITEQTSLQNERRDSSLNQAQTLIDLMKSLGVSDPTNYKEAISEVLSESLPNTGSDVMEWTINASDSNEEI